MATSFEIADGVEFESVYERFHPLIQGILQNLGANASDDHTLDEKGLSALEEGLEALKHDPSEFVQAIDALIEVAYRWDNFPLVDEDGEPVNPGHEPEYRALAHQVLDALENEEYVAIYKANGAPAPRSQGSPSIT